MNQDREFEAWLREAAREEAESLRVLLRSREGPTVELLGRELERAVMDARKVTPP